MIEHASIPVSDFERSKEFYTQALKPLGYHLEHDWSPDAAGFMQGGHTDFVISHKSAPQATHLAFRAKSENEVDEFYKAALDAGAKDNGAPGPREDYGYAAFVYDFDGNNIEAVYFSE